MDHRFSSSRRTLLAGLAAALVARPALAAAPSLHDEGPAPEFTGIERWLQSPPLTMAALRGQVVLVDFWTYACVNCIRTLPHVNLWAETYRQAGLVVVGVHTPEFAFERSTANLETAMRRHGVKHAVARTTATQRGKPTATSTGPRTTSSTRAAASSASTSAKAPTTAPRR